MQIKRLTILFALLALFICIVTAKKSDGTKKGTEQNGFVYLDRFAYDVNPVPVSEGGKRVPVGWIEAEFTFKNKDDFGKALTLWEYTDAENDWPKIYPKSVDCQQKVVLSGGNTHEQLTIDQNTGKATVKLHALGGTRRRFHYMALVHCGGFGEFDYNLHFYRESSKWTREFGVNDSGINTFYILWFILYVFFTVAVGFNFQMFSKKQSFVHPILKLFSLTVVLAFLNVLCELIHWGGYTTNGKGHPIILALGDVCEILASGGFLVLLLLLAQGWAISSGLHNSNLKRRNITIGFVAFFTLMKVIAFFLKLFKSNPAETGTGDGIIVFWNFMLVFDLAFAAFYVFSLFGTVKAETNPVKNRFMKFLLIFVLYIIATAATALISYLLDPWVRDFLVNIVAVITLTIAQIVMLYLLWFTRSAEYFELTAPTELVHDDLNYENF